MLRTPLAVGLTAVALAALSACGTSSSTATDASTDQPTPAASGQPGGQFGGGSGQGFPGTSGKIAAIQGKTLQVQGTDGQTAVTYTASTTITADVSTTLQAVKVGSCVTVTPTDDSSSTDTTSVTAASVRITQASGGSCTGGFSGGGGSFSGGGGSFPSDRPSDFPTDRPTDFGSGGPGGFGGRMRGAFGQVSAVSGDGFTVTSSMPSQDGSSGSQTVTVTVTRDTTYSTTASASATSLKVGKCVTAAGDSDDTGAIKATTIQVSSPVDGECTGGFGGFRGGSGA